MVENNNSENGTIVSSDESLVQGTVVAPEGTTVAAGTMVADGTVVASPKQSRRAPTPGNNSNHASFRLNAGERIVLSGKTFTVVRGVSSGTEAELYVVSDDGGEYAVKLYNPGFAPNAKIFPEVMSISGTPNIVNLHQAGIADFSGEALPYVLMEFCEYGAADNYTFKSDVGSLLAIAVQAARALEVCHKNKILHKDIKPANILVRKRFPMEICLCDFGIADQLTANVIRTSQSRTAIYAAPEMYKTGIMIDGRSFCKLGAPSDYYSLGMSLLSLWVGEKNLKENEVDLAYQKQEGRVKVPANMPSQLKTIVLGLLDPDPSQRWALGQIEQSIKDVIMPVPKEEGLFYDVVNNLIIRDRVDLSNYLLSNLSRGESLLYRGRLYEMLKNADADLAVELSNITETLYPRDRETGLQAAIIAINPNVPIRLKTSNRVSIDAYTPEEVVNFCCSHKNLSRASKEYLISTVFVTWLKGKDEKLAQTVSSVLQQRPDLAEDLRTEFIYRLVIQTMDPFADMNLCNDVNDPHYAMTGEGIAWYINEIFNVFFSQCGGDEAAMKREWSDDWNGLTGLCSPAFARLIIHSFDKKMTSHKSSFLIASLRTKGNRFKDQIKWINHCTDTEPIMGPKYNVETAMMKAVMGLGKVPEYYFYRSEQSVKSLSDLESIPNSEVQEQLNKGLKGWLAVQFQDNVNLTLSDNQDFQDQLDGFYATIGRYDTRQEEAWKREKDSRPKVEPRESESVSVGKKSNGIKASTIVFMIVIFGLLIIMITH